MVNALLGLMALSSKADPFGQGSDLYGLLAWIGDARALAIFSLEASGETRLDGAAGMPADYLRRYPVGERVTRARLPGDLRECARKGEPVQVVGLATDPRTVSLSSVAREGRFEASLAIPLIYNDRVLGMIHAFYGAHYQPEQQQVLARVAPLLAASLARDRLARDHDSAGLYGVALVDRQLRQTHAAAQRYDHAYAVAVYALDQPDRLLKKLGPELIQQAMDSLAELIAAEARDADVVGYGGASSFVVIMPGTAQQGAFSQCSRVLERFGRTPFKVGDRRLQLSASAGISCYPENGALSAEASAKSARQTLTKAVGDTGRRMVAIAARGAALEG